MEMKNVAVVGCGEHATNWILPNLARSGLRLKALCDLDPRRVDENLERFGAEQGYTDYREMLKRTDLDGVLLCGPAKDVHYRIGLDVLRAGLDCYTEKPPSHSAQQSLEALELSRKTGKLLFCGFKKRYSYSYSRLKDIIDGGLIGRELSLNLFDHKRAHPEYIFRSLVHSIDLLRFLFGEVKRVLSQRIESKPSPRGFRIEFLGLVWFENGTVASVDLSSRRTDRFGSEGLEVTGELGFASVENSTCLKRYRDGELVEMYSPNFSATRPLVSGIENELTAFAACLRGEGGCRSDAYSSYKTMQLLEAFTGSRGEIVEVADD